MMHNCVIGKVVNLWTQVLKYNMKRFKEVSINQQQYSNNENLFTLNVLAITFIQFAITFGGTYLFILVQQISAWIDEQDLFLWVTNAIYLLLQLILVFVPALSRKYPYNIIYLILMTSFSTVAIASDATLYKEDTVTYMFGVSVTLFNLIIYTITILRYDFTKYYLTNLFLTLFIDLTLLIGQSLYIILDNNNIVLIVAGAVGLPITLFKLLYEVKMIFGNGEFRYEQTDLLLAAAFLYNCWWSLFLTLMWISSYSGWKRTDRTNSILSNLTSSVNLITLTTSD